MTNRIQVSGRIGEMIFVLGGDTPEAFLANAKVIVGDQGASDLCEMMQMALVGSGPQKAIEAQAERNAIDAGFTPAASPQATAPASTPAAAPVAASAPATAAGEATEVDRYGAKFVYNKAGASNCPHGQRVWKEWVSQSGKDCKAYVCPTQSPSAYRQGVAKDGDCKPEWQRS